MKKFGDNAELDLPAQAVKQVSEVSIRIHQGVDEMNKSFYLQTKRRNYLTPSNYLDFLELYFKFYKSEKITLPNKIKKYREGLKKMRETKDRIQQLQQQIIENQPKIEVAARENAILKQSLEQQNAIAREKETQVEAEA